MIKYTFLYEKPAYIRNLVLRPLKKKTFETAKESF